MNENNNDNNIELEYIKINELLKANRNEYNKYENISIYGVIVYIGETKVTKQNAYSTRVTIVDDTCGVGNKLKCVTFTNDKTKTINSLCKIGDIIRFHRFKIQSFNDNIQGCAPFYASWVAFDSVDDSVEYKTRTNKQKITSINDYDKKRVDELRKWSIAHLDDFLLRDTNYHNIPQPAPSITNTTASTSTSNANNVDTNNHTNDDTSTSPLQQQQQQQQHNSTSHDGLLIKDYSTQMVTYSKMKQESYFNIVCQLCAKCYYNNDKDNCVFLLTWDATKTNFAVHSEIDYGIENENMLFVNDLTYYIQIYVFDEYIQQLDDLNVGDYLLIVNLRSTKPHKSNIDTVVKLPGCGGQLYGRAIIKLDQNSLVYSHSILKSIQRIEEKKNELNVKLIKSADFKRIINAKSSCKHKINANAEDDDEDDDDDDESDEAKANKNKKNDGNSCQKVDNRENSESLAFKTKRRLFTELVKDMEEMYDKYNNICINQNKQTILQHRRSNNSILNGTNNSNKSITNNDNENESEIDKRNNNNNNNNNSSDNNRDLIDSNNKTLPIKISSQYILFSKTLERLYKHVYLTPITITNDEDDENMDLLNVLTFNDILNDNNNNKTKSYKCKVIAKLHNYTTQKTLPISFLYVFCEQCNYINTLPYHFVNVFEPNIASKLYIIETNTNYNNNYEFDYQKIDENDYSANFNIKWLFNVIPSKHVKITSSSNNDSIKLNMCDNRRGNNDGSNVNDVSSVTSYVYDCPRCFKLAKKKVLLKYIYRFPFKLIDSNKIELKPCLFEYKSAFKLVNYVDPLEYCCFKQKTKYVFDQIHKLMTCKKVLFIIEVINNNINCDIMPNKENRIYKIIDFSVID